MDTHTFTQHHVNMAAINGKNTKPEMVVRRWLWRHGYRYRLNHPRLPGKPDIVMRKHRTCIFVNASGTDTMCSLQLHKLIVLSVVRLTSKIKDENLLRRRTLFPRTMLVVSAFRALNAARFRRRIVTSGWQRYGGIKSETQECSMSWLRWAGR